MTKKLPSDAPRCHGFCCPQREMCMRYTERKNYKDSTRFERHLCSEDAEGYEHYIPTKEQK